MKQENRIALLWAYLIMRYMYVHMRWTKIRRCRQPLAIKGCAMTQFYYYFYLYFFLLSVLRYLAFVYSRMSSALRGERIFIVQGE